MWFNIQCNINIHYIYTNIIISDDEKKFHHTNTTDYLIISTEITGLPSNGILLQSETNLKIYQQVFRIFFVDKLARINVFSDFISIWTHSTNPNIYLFCNQYQKQQK